MLLSAKYIYVFGPTFHGALVEVGAVILVAPGSLSGISQPVHGVFIGSYSATLEYFIFIECPLTLETRAASLWNPLREIECS